MEEKRNLLKGLYIGVAFVLGVFAILLSPAIEILAVENGAAVRICLFIGVLLLSASLISSQFILELDFFGRLVEILFQLLFLLLIWVSLISFAYIFFQDIGSEARLVIIIPSILLTFILRQLARRRARRKDKEEWI